MLQRKSKIKRNTPLKRTWFRSRVSAKQRAKIERRKKLCDRWWAEGRRKCGICGLTIWERHMMVPDHILPGTAKSEAEDNLQPAHGICNTLKGSKRNYTREQCLRDLGIL